jgi:predicted DNA-binding transcriptional regulator AlpA
VNITDDTDPLLTDKESAPIFNFSVPTFHRRVADGTIPKPIKIGGLARWPKSELLAVIAALKAKRAA